MRAAADRLHIRLSIEHVTDQQEIEKAFASLSQLGAGAVFVLADPLFNDRSDQLVELQHRYSLPTAFAPEFGGLMGYSANVTSVFHDLGTYTGRVLKGARPEDLPVEQTTKIEVVINLKTAKALGLRSLSQSSAARTR